jgi:hypothetical protein
MRLACTVALLCSGFLCANCANSLAPKLPDSLTVVSAVTLTPAQVTAIQTAVRARLKDPASAAFGGIAAGSNSEGTIQVCGLVNAKNSYGGYNGMTTYAGDLRGTSFTFGGLGSEIGFGCEQQGLRPSG